LKTLYKDENGIKAAELDEMGGILLFCLWFFLVLCCDFVICVENWLCLGVGPNVYSAFYEKLKEIKGNSFT
jgi:hypothetical protein